MTQREAQFFVQGIQFAFGGMDESMNADGLTLAIRVIAALDVDALEMVRLTPEIHHALDAGGFRGEDRQRRAKQ